MLVALAAQAACTRANPAYRPDLRVPDASAATSIGLEPDAAPPPPDAALDLGWSLDLASPDLPAPPDLPRPTPAGLAARWRLDEEGGNEANDDMGFSPGVLHNGVARVGDTFPGARFPNPRAASFDGDDDYVELGTATLPAMEAAKTISLWCRPSTVVMTGRRNLIVFNNRDAQQSLQLGLEDGRPAVWSWGPARAPLIAGRPLEARWYHLAYVFDGTTQRLYVDGQPAAMRTAPPPASPVTAAYLGTYDPDSDGTELWRGLIDDVRVYERGLEPDEIAWLAAGGD